MQKHLNLATILLLFFMMSCQETPQKKVQPSKEKNEIVKPVKKDTVVENKSEAFILNDKNAIPFLNEYAKNNKENKVRITTSFGSFIIELYNNTPYHRANFIYLTKKEYFNGTYFHRVVENFIIQGGNADNNETARKRREIGKYLLPPDTRKGHKHHRGTVSMPSSDIANPHKLASPFEFFIVVTKPGSYHLDGNYTAFGRVIQGMDVVDKINSQPTDIGEWPMQNIPMQVEIIE
jgi:cyclophilin family peptidyl-prolyl cis-trans isomerase